MSARVRNRLSDPADLPGVRVVNHTAKVPVIGPDIQAGYPVQGISGVGREDIGLVAAQRVSPGVLQVTYCFKAGRFRWRPDRLKAREQSVPGQPSQEKHSN